MQSIYKSDYFEGFLVLHTDIFISGITARRLRLKPVYGRLVKSLPDAWKQNIVYPGHVKPVQSRFLYWEKHSTIEQKEQ